MENINSLLKKIFCFIDNNPRLTEYVEQPIFFTRKRTLSFSIVVSTILNLFKESVEFNISTILPLFELKPVTGAAFSLARYKISLSFFKHLNKISVDFHQRSPAKFWRGYQLIAGDGSTVGMPLSGQMKEHFGVYAEKGNGTKSCMAQIFMFFDVFTNVVISSRISRMCDSETRLFKDCLTELPSHKSIVILDWGFGYFYIFKLLRDLNKDFCIRISTKNSSFAKRMMAHPGNDFTA